MSNNSESNRSTIRIHMPSGYNHRRTMTEAYQINTILKKQDYAIDNTMKKFEYYRKIEPHQMKVPITKLSFLSDRRLNLAHKNLISPTKLLESMDNPDCQAALKSKLNDLEEANERIKTENFQLKTELYGAMKQSLQAKYQESELNCLRQEAEKFSNLLSIMNKENQILRKIIREKYIY